jgi:Holliday junction resolvase RusA-like endonuclease
MCVVLELLGKPVPAARARVLRRGFAFNPKEKEKKLAQEKISELYKSEILDEPLRVELSFQMQIPKSLSKKKRSELIGSPHVIKPDCDNLAKFTLDVMNGIIYRDDSCVFDLKSTKTYSNEPKTTIRIYKHEKTA